MAQGRQKGYDQDAGSQQQSLQSQSHNPTPMTRIIPKEAADGKKVRAL
jgi:hypothetical protein